MLLESGAVFQLSLSPGWGCSEIVPSCARSQPGTEVAVLVQTVCVPWLRGMGLISVSI